MIKNNQPGGAPRAKPVAPLGSLGEPRETTSAEAHPEIPRLRSGLPADTFIHGQSPWLSAQAGKFGFSIPEIMLVIGIIAILASASLVLLDPVQALKRSRDAVRLHDLNTLKSALILALQNGSIFGSRCLSISPCDSLNNSLVSDGSGYVDLDLSKDLTTLPRDPSSGGPNFIDSDGQTVPSSFQFAHDGTGNFEIRAHLEAKDSLGKYAADGGNNSGYYEIGTKLDIL